MKFLNNLKIGPKIILLVLALIVVLIASISFVNSNGLMNYVEEETTLNAAKGVESLELYFNSLKDIAKENAVMISRNPEFYTAVQSNDRQQISVSIKKIIADANFDFVTITDANGIVLYRTHEPEKYGDDVSKNLDIRSALSNQAVAGVITGTVVPIAIRSAVPIFDMNSNRIGVISTGFRLDNPAYLDKYKKIFDMDFTVFKDDLRINTTIQDDNGKRAVGTKLKEDIAKHVLKDGKIFSGKAEVRGKDRIVYYKPLIGLENKPIGLLFAGVLLERAEAQRNEILMTVIIFSVIALSVIAVLLYFIVKAFIVKPIMENVNVAGELANGNFNIEVNRNRKDEFGIMNESMAIMINSQRSMLEDVHLMAHAAVDGNLKTRADVKKHKGEYAEIISGMNNTMDAIVAPLSLAIDYLENIAKGNIPTTVTQNLNGEYNNIKQSLNLCITSIQALITDTNDLVKSAEDGNLDKRADAAKHNGDYRKIIVGINNTLDSILNPISATVNVLKEMREGNLSERVKGEFKGDHAELKNILNETLDSLPLAETMAVMQELAVGNLTIKMTKEYKGDSLKLKNAVNDTIDSLNEILGNVRSTVEEVTRAAMQVSDTSTALSQGATEQAASLEEITSSMGEIGSQTRLNAENANMANSLAHEARDAAEKGNAEMGQLTDAMNEINESSKNISKIIKVIDEIAFQTNLLALNAAVEAARAGRHGKGFAVVAEEVRNLAARSATAAKETSEMIENSIKTVERGTGLVAKTGDALSDIQNSSVKVADIIGEITTSSNEQAQGISQINEGLTQIDKVTQTNTASAEESASAAEELSGQSNQLRELVDRFKLAGRNTSMSMNYGTRQLKRPSNTNRSLPSHSVSPVREEDLYAMVDDSIRNSGISHNAKDIIKLDEDDFDRY